MSKIHPRALMTVQNVQHPLALDCTIIWSWTTLPYTRTTINAGSFSKLISPSPTACGRLNVHVLIVIRYSCTRSDLSTPVSLVSSDSFLCLPYLTTILPSPHYTGAQVWRPVSLSTLGLAKCGQIGGLLWPSDLSILAGCSNFTIVNGSKHRMG